jgi:hypothetical protein
MAEAARHELDTVKACGIIETQEIRMQILDLRFKSVHDYEYTICILNLLVRNKDYAWRASAVEDLLMLLASCEWCRVGSSTSRYGCPMKAQCSPKLDICWDCRRISPPFILVSQHEQAFHHIYDTFILKHSRLAKEALTLLQ